MIKYDKDKMDEKLNAQKTRPRLFMVPQISLDDVVIDRRDKLCTFVYCSSKTMSDLTSGVSAIPNLIPVIDDDSTPKLFDKPVKKIKYFRF